MEELYGTRYQSGSFSLINVGSGFYCLRSFFSFLCAGGQLAPTAHVLVSTSVRESVYVHEPVGASVFASVFASVCMRAGGWVWVWEPCKMASACSVLRETLPVCAV